MMRLYLCKQAIYIHSCGYFILIKLLLHMGKEMSNYNEIYSN